MVAMARGHLLCWVLAACVFHAPRAEPPRITGMDPPDGTQYVPSKSFNIRLSFQEAVQAGPGIIQISHSSGSGQPLPVACFGGLLIQGTHAIVPVLEELQAGANAILVPANCFQSQAGEAMQAPVSSTFLVSSLRAPRLRQELTFPPSGSWIAPSQRFTFVFSEAVQGGDALVSIVQSRALTSSTFLSVEMDQPNQAVQFDPTFPGVITFDLGRLPSSAVYDFKSEAGAVRSLAGFPVGGIGFLGGGSYSARVAAGLVRQLPPGQSSSVSRHTSIVLEFDSPVVPGSEPDAVKLCTSWRKEDPCATAVSVPAEGVHFLGRFLIFRPAVDLQPGVHNVSVSPEVARYFRGLTPNWGAWPYSFSVSSQGAVDSAAPEFVVGLVDCGQGYGVGQEVCLSEGLPAGFTTISGSAGSSVGIPSGAKIKLYFSERVEVAPSRNAILRESDSSSAPTPVAVSVGSGSDDCVATLELNLKPVTRYTLTFSSGVLTDGSASKNAYAGGTFSIYSPLTLVSSTVAGGVKVPSTSTIRLTFDAAPRPDAQAFFTIFSDATDRGRPAALDSRTVQLSDIDQVLFQEQSLFLTPRPALLNGRTYIITMKQQALEFLPTDLVLTFSTRADDTRKPVPIHTAPEGTLSKFSLDRIAPSVRFSERVAPMAGRRIIFRVASSVQYILDATDNDCGVGGTEEDACVVTDQLGSQVSFYPRGKLALGSALPAAWATAGTTYHIEIEAGAFADAVQLGAVANGIDEMQFTFFATSDESGPYVVSGDPPGDPPGSDASVDTNANSVFLDFNEIVEGGDNNIAIMACEHVGTRAPSLVAAGPAKLRLEVGGGWRQTVVLSFDTAIQAASTGDAQLQLHDLGTEQLRASVPLLDATIASNLLLFNISSAAAGMPSWQERYFVRSSTADAIVSVTGVASNRPFDTREAAVFEASASSSSATDNPLTMLWTSAEEFLCFPADGILPDFEVYMSQEISSLGTSRAITLYECDQEACSSKAELWSLSVGGAMVRIDLAKPFRVLIQTSKLAAGLAGAQGSPLKVYRYYRLDLEAGALQGFGDTAPLSTSLSIPFSVCEARYGVPASTLLRLYSPKTFALSASQAARRFEVRIAQSALTDMWGNPPASALTFSFMHEAELPVLEPASSNPPDGSIANPKENVILAFNEVVQSGSGFLQLWDVQAKVVRFEIDVATIAARSVDGQNLISDRYVIMTPKTLCDESPACTDLVPGQSYYLKTSAPGVLKDSTGNKLPQLDTAETWTFSVSTQDTRPPKLAFIAGHTLLPAYDFYPPQFVGYAYFTEQVVQNPGAAVTFQDCGPDLDCNTNADNSVSYLPAQLSFGDGTGTSGYGLMRYSRYMTSIDRRYKVRIMPNLVSDVVANGPAQTAPAQMYVFNVEVGDVGIIYEEDNIGPRLGRKTPVNTERGVEPDCGLVLNFNEDVQRGTGAIQFCLNGDAMTRNGPPCNPGTWADGTAATLDISNGIIDRRRVIFDFPKKLRYKQTLFVLMPEGLVKDIPAGNPSQLVEMTMYRFYVRSGDVTPPQLNYYTIPTTSSGSIQLYFSEAVQLGTAARSLKVVGSSSSSALDLTTLISGNAVSMQGPWTEGVFYTLDLPSNAFKDLEGNTMAYSLASPQFSIPAPNGGPFANMIETAVSQACDETLIGNGADYRGCQSQTRSGRTCQPWTVHSPHAHVNTPDLAPGMGLDGHNYCRNPASLSTIWCYTTDPGTRFEYCNPLQAAAGPQGMSLPANGSTEVVPSASFTVKFEEMVQAGSGLVFFGPDSIPVEQCTFVGQEVVCDPPGYWERNQLYTVTFPPQSVENAAGASFLSSNLVFTFRTIDLDLVPPVLESATDEALDNINPSSLLTLYFNEVVQAGTGFIFVEDSDSGELKATIDIQGKTPGTEVYFMDSIVSLAKPALTHGRQYTLYTSVQGVILDLDDQPLGQITKQINVLTNDTTPPTILAYIPRNESTGEAAPNADIRLYFSEAVQAVSTAGVAIKVSDGLVTELVPLVGQSHSSGSVTISGSVATVNPYRSMGYGRLVTMTVPAGAFSDFAGNLYAGSSQNEPYQWQTAIPVFEEVQSTGGVPPGRSGAVLESVLGSTLLLHGGRSDGVCHSDTYTSSTGSTWQRQSSQSSDPARPVPGVADAASAADASGCVWLLGGQCSGIGTNIFWKTCSKGATWDPLPVPSSLVQGVVWPESFSGQAIAILGGWQLVVVDLGRGDFWLFQDRGATTVVRTAEGLAFAPRRASTLLVSSSNDLYLVGGHNCNDQACSNGQVFTDVWRSAESFYVGQKWEFLTMSYVAGVSSSDQTEIGKQGAAAVMTYDDTIYILGGRNGKNSVAAAFSSMPGPGDLMFDAAPRITVPLPTEVVHSLDVVKLYFGESIFLQSATSVKLIDLGLDKSVGGTGDDADSALPFVVSAEGQVLQLQRGDAPKLLAGHTYRVVVSDGALTDVEGNSITGFTPYQFSVNSDRTGPILSVVVPTGTSVPSWTTFVLEADDELLAGSGSLELSCPAGASYNLAISTAQLVGKRAFFELPAGSKLTEGQQYTIRVPEGLFVDLAGNTASAVSFTFRVLSGVVSTSPDGYAATGVVQATVTTGNPLDTTPPRLVQISPPSGATDVPLQSVAILVSYSEPVKFGSSGVISLQSSQASTVVEAMNVANMSAADSGRLFLVTNGVKLMLRDLQAGVSYTFSIPAGVITDMAGNPAPAVTTTFTCLAGWRDTKPPILVMTEPPAGATGVPGDLTRITMWFSEEVEAGIGSINITRPAGAKVLLVPIASSNVTINGSRLELTLRKGALDTAGSCSVLLPTGVVQDKRRSLPDEGGGAPIEQVSFAFTARPADILPPSLVATEPPSEGPEPSFELPMSTTLLLTFSETVQAGVGAATLVPQLGPRSLSFDVNGPDVVFAGNHMLIVPDVDLAPGEVYSLRMSDPAVVDLAGNSFTGLGAGDYIVSTAPRILFQRLTSPFNGARYSVGATVDSANNVYVVGGGDSSVPNSTRRDVWRLRTERASNCRAYFSSVLKCPRDSCSGTPPSLGLWDASRVVWHAPTMDGRRCLDSNGMPQSQVGDLVGQETGTCPCPECPDLPLPLPINMVNSTYIRAYEQEVATGRPRPLLCKTGYVATGGFSCHADTAFAAKWNMPYPSCEPRSCTAPPPAVEWQDPSTAGAMSPCFNVSVQKPLAHGSTCPMLCMPGYKPRGLSKGSGAFKCRLGMYETPVCEPQRCVNRYSINNGTLQCMDEEVFFGGSCIVLCNAGFELVGEKFANCTGTSSMPESTPELTKPGFCQPRSCGDLQLSDPHGLVLGYANDLQTTGSFAYVGCEEGYMPSDSSFENFQCISNSNVQEEESGWIGALNCVRRPCNIDISVTERGYFNCGQVLFGDECKLECDLGYVMHNGDGMYKCQADGRMVGEGSCREVSCPAPPMGRVPHAIKNDCPLVMSPGVECEVISCRDGYEPRGSFMCKYGGFNKMPACVAAGVKADIKWYYLSALTLFCDLPNADLVKDEWYWTEAESAIADGLNQVQLTQKPIVDNVVLLNDLSTEELPRSQGKWRIWITFRVRAQNVSEINYWLGQKQALVKARFAASLEVRVANLKIYSMLLAPAEVAIAYAEQQAPKTIIEEDDFMERLTNLDNTDSAEVALGAMVGIVLGLMASLLCVCMYRRYQKKPEGNESNEATEAIEASEDNKPFRREVS